MCIYYYVLKANYCKMKAIMKEIILKIKEFKLFNLYYSLIYISNFSIMCLTSGYFYNN